MRIMIISDIHGDYDCLKNVLDFYEEKQCNQLIILGDLLYHGPRNDLPAGYAPKKCIPLQTEKQNGSPAEESEQS